MSREPGPRRTTLDAPVVAAAPRLAARAQAERRARWRRLGGWLGRGLAVLVALGALAWVLLWSGWLAVDRIDVVGTGRLDVAQVREAAGVEDGTALATVDTAAVRDRVAGLAPVAQVEVLRSWPGTLRITLTERVGVAAVAVPGGVQLVDAEGVVFATEPALPAGLVRLEVSSPGPEDAATLAALSVLLDLPASLREQVLTVRAQSPSSVSLLLAEDRTVVWGAPGDTETKAAAIEVLLRMEGSVLDVSAPGVVVRS